MTDSTITQVNDMQVMDTDKNVKKKSDADSTIVTDEAARRKQSRDEVNAAYPTTEQERIAMREAASVFCHFLITGCKVVDDSHVEEFVANMNKHHRYEISDPRVFGLYLWYRQHVRHFESIAKYHPEDTELQESEF